MKRYAFLKKHKSCKKQSVKMRDSTHCELQQLPHANYKSRSRRKVLIRDSLWSLCELIREFSTFRWGRIRHFFTALKVKIFCRKKTVFNDFSSFLPLPCQHFFHRFFSRYFQCCFAIANFFFNGVSHFFSSKGFVYP